MLDTSEKLLCGCGCGVGIVEIRATPDGPVLRFRKRANGLMHYLEIPLPKGTSFDTLDKRPTHRDS